MGICQCGNIAQRFLVVNAFGDLPEDGRIATYKAKWDDNYREKWGIKSVYAGKLANGVEKEIVDVCKRAYRALDVRSYLRLDIRVLASRRYCHSGACDCSDGDILT